MKKLIFILFLVAISTEIFSQDLEGIEITTAVGGSQEISDANAYFVPPFLNPHTRIPTQKIQLITVRIIAAVYISLCSTPVILVIAAIFAGLII